MTARFIFKNLRLLGLLTFFVSAPIASNSNPIPRLIATKVVAIQQNDNRSHSPSPLFLPTKTYLSGGQLAWNAVLADMDDDGKPDIVAVNYSGWTNGDGSVSVRLGNGDGSFRGKGVQDSGGWFSVSVAVADLNRDGKLDLVVTSGCNANCSSSQSVVAVLMGRGDGTMRPPVTYSTGGFPFSSGEGSSLPVIVADVNHDGKPDLVIVNQTDRDYGDGELGVLIGNGDGTFQSVVSYRSGGFDAGSFAIADLNGDGKLDLAVVNCAPSGTTACPGNGGNVAVLLGNGDGTFQTAQSYDRGGWGFFSDPLLVADVNHDGKRDILVGNYCTTQNSTCAGNGSVGVLLGRGDGTFRAAVAYDSGGFDASSIVFADVNGDGKPDLVVANGAAGVLLGNGDGTFQPAHSYATNGNTGSVAVTDLNGDGHPDMVATNGTSNSAAILLGNGDGTFQNEQSFPLGGSGFASPVAVADLNGDGRPDLVAANWYAMSNDCCPGTVGVLVNKSGLASQSPLANGYNSAPGSPASPYRFWQARFYDFNVGLCTNELKSRVPHVSPLLRDMGNSRPGPPAHPQLQVISR